MFASLPTGFLGLQQATDLLGKVELVAPKNLEDIGVRMRKLYALAREHGYERLSKGALRRLPYALWIDGEPPLEEVEPNLLRLYWERMLPDALAHARSAKRWLTPLFYTYCHWFRRFQPGFRRFAQVLRLALTNAQGPMAEALRELQRKFNWFKPDEVGEALGTAMASPSKPMPEVLTELSLWSGFLEESIAGEAFAGALQSPLIDLTDEAMIQRLLQWSRVELPGGKRGSVSRYPEHRVLLANRMLAPWAKRQPSEAIKKRLLSFFIKHYGDPRLLDNSMHGYNWHGVDPSAVATIKRWLVGDTLRGFMRILQLTADDIWRFRERFWMAYYDHGVIEEAWLVLGSQAAWRAQREFGEAEWAQYGTLTAGATSDQSVLFLRIGDIVFMEWSHNGSLRASRLGDPQTPAMYLKEYSGHDLRLVRSLDFHRGLNQQPQLTHAGSERGHWQRRARDFIAKHTGVNLNDQAIIG